MSKKLKLLLVGIPLLALLPGCDAEIKYTVKEVPVYGYDLNYVYDVECRYYDDIKDLPYIDINTYYKLLLDKEVEINPISANKYEVKTFTGSATIDVKNDILHSEDYNQFINTTIYRSGDSRNSYYDDAPYLRIADYTATEEVTPKTIDFKKYNIDFKYDEGKIWAPLITFSDMFKGVTMIQSFYDGEKIRFFDSNKSTVDLPFYYESYYAEAICRSFYRDGKRDPKLAEISYLELCFNIDNYYGYPGRSPLEDLIRSNGFDYALQNYSDSTRLVKEYLLSTDINKYLAGVGLLNNLLNDGGHTSFISAVFMMIYSDNFESYGSAQKVHEYMNNPNYIKIPENTASRKIYDEARNEMDANETFKSKGDTFVYRFDSFSIDYKSWDNYYSGATQELPKDTIGNFHRAINLAKQDPNIENFVIDLTTNGGGFGDVVIYMMDVIAGKPEMYFYDHIDKRNIKQNYLCDINLDGKFDELDKEPIADFNFGILTSNYSFSCGNLLPALAKDAGIPILGAATGGGACAVLDNCAMEGIFYRLSSFLHLTDTKFNSIDAGVSVDYDLIGTEETPNYKNLYDIDLLSEKMNDFYNK